MNCHVISEFAKKYNLKPKIFVVYLQIGDDQCSINKYAFEHEGTIQYEQSLPKLDQFTLCAWMRFTNHSGDHSIFTYASKYKRFFFFFHFFNALLCT